MTIRKTEQKGFGAGHAGEESGCRHGEVEMSMI